VAITKAEERRIAMKGTLFSLPAFAVAIMLVVAFGETFISWAENWPGGPAGFMVTLGAGASVCLLLLCVACLVYAWPERTPPRLRIPDRARAAFAWGGGGVFILALVPLASTLPLRRRGHSDSSASPASSDCDETGFGCFMRTEHGGAVGLGWLTFIVIVIAGSAILAWLFRRKSTPPADPVQPTRNV
jgi:hypothetical protein